MIELQAFNNFAAEYDNWFDSHQREYAQELKAISELLPKKGNGIEVGAGTGRFSKPLGVSLGIEPSRAMRNIALKRGVNIVAGLAEYLPVKDHLYDYALLVTTDCFLKMPELAFKEIHRVLKADGFIIIGLIDKNSRLGKKYEKSKNTNKFYKNANFHSVEQIQGKLAKTGFSNIDCVQAILPDDINSNYKGEVKQGYGEGSFVVLQAQKQNL